MNSDDEEEIQNENGQELYDSAREEGTKRKQEIATKSAQKVLKKAGFDGIKEQVVSKAVGLLGPLIPYIIAAAVIILIIIALVGIIAFLVTAPGLMTDKLKSFGNSIAEGFKKLYTTDANATIDDKEIIEMAKYINGMGYDLVGFGFVKPNDEKGTKLAEQLVHEGYTRVTDENNPELVFFENSNGERFKDKFIDSDGKCYNGATGKIISETDGVYEKYGIEYDSSNKIASLDKVDSSLLKKYAISNRRIYILRNDDEGFGKSFLNLVNDFWNNTDYTSWSNGLVKIYTAKNFIAEDVFIKDGWLSYLINKLSGTLDPDADVYNTAEFTGDNKLKIQKGSDNVALTFETDGWIGRYGLSQDFLISLHLATLSPDLVESIVRSYDTEVQVYADEVTNAQATVRMIDSASTIIGDEENALKMSDFTIDKESGEEGRFVNTGINIEDAGLDLEELIITNEQAVGFFHELDMDSPSTCTYSYKGDLPNREFYSIENVKLPEENIDTALLDDPEAVADIVTKFVEGLNQNYGFEIEKFNAQVSLSDDDGCATGEFIRDYVYENDIKNKTINIEPEELNRRINREFFKDNSVYDKNLNVIYNPDDKSGGLYIDGDVEGEKVLLYDSRGESIPIGRVCAFEYGIYDYQDGQIKEPERLNCDCKFCTSFWKKLVCVANASNDENFYANDDVENVSDKYIADLYTWESNESGELLQYSISFYKSNDGIKICVNRGWNDHEARTKMENYPEKCSDAIHEHEELENAKDVKVCPQCKKYVKYIIKSLKKIEDRDYSAYEPYIARVVNSWFRDTYFIIPKDASKDVAVQDAIINYGYDDEELTGDTVNVIANDSEFLKATGELWTQYIMEPDGNDYAKFVLNTTGELLKYDEIDDYLKRLDVNDNDKSSLKALMEEYDNGEKLVRWLGNDEHDITDEEDESIKLLQNYEISLVKVPVTQTIGSNSEENSEIAWNAYNKNGKNITKWSEVPIDGSSPSYMRKAVEYYGGGASLSFEVGLDGVFNLNQVEDAQRGMTNAKIKYLFKNKKYYSYDGTVERAYKIKDDWNACLELAPDFLGLMDISEMLEEEVRSLFKTLATGPDYIINQMPLDKAIVHENALNSYIDAIYYRSSDTLTEIRDKFVKGSFDFVRDFDGDGNADLVSESLNHLQPGDTYKFDGTVYNITASTVFSYDPRNPDLINNIDLTTESLAAFSILENTHTADADYAYRDLKELFCELEYFDKEDLTEPAKDVLEWLLPESGSYGWPVRMFDKNIEYGSLIHSSEMYNNLEEVLLQLDGIESTAVEEEQNEIEQQSNIANLTNVNEDEILRISNTRIASRDESSTSTDNQFKKSTFLETAQACWEYVVQNQPKYGVPGGVYKPNEKNIIDCSGYVGFVLHNYGYEDWTFFGTAIMMEEDYTEKHGFKEIDLPGKIDDISILQPGDILVRVGNDQNGNYRHHTQIIKEVNLVNNEVIVYDCGAESNWDEKNIDGLSSKFYDSAAPGKIIRVENSGKNSEEKIFEGFEKGQPIVSPATAKILEIGTMTVDNENTESILETIYIAGSEAEASSTQTNTAENSEENESSTTATKIAVTEEEYNKIKENAEAKENDEESSFGKSYETGYIKLEIIGSETLEKLKNIPELSKENIDGIEAFYQDYYNENTNKSICDSYIMYITGIDLTGSLETEEGTLSSLDETILGQMFSMNNETGVSISNDGIITTNDAVKDEEDDEEQSILSGDSDPVADSSTTDQDDFVFDINNYEINYYTEKLIPNYYVESAAKDLRLREDAKLECPSIMKINENLYIKAGTLLGICGDSNIKIILRDKENAVVENVEDYLEIDPGKKASSGLDIDLARFFFVPYEGGYICENASLGVTTCIDTTENDGIPGVAVGLCCWTTHIDGSCNCVPDLFAFMVEKEPDFCSRLKKYCGMNEDEIYSNLTNIAQDLKGLDEVNHNLMVELQLAYKDYEVEKLLEQSARQDYKWILERSPGLIGTYYSLVNWIPYPYAYNNYSTNTKTWEECLDENKSDEENIISLMKYALEKGPKLSARWHSQCRFAIDIVQGNVTEEELMSWLMEEKDPDIIEKYDNGKNPNYINEY